ncbi:hypothetical protein JCM10449v2_000516 [Rhodotorula kratochvilovae]
MLAVLSLLSLAASLITAVPLPAGNSSELVSHLDRRATVLADGTSLQYGSLSGSVDWQASGVLSQGCDLWTGITDCYTLSLAPSGQLARRSIASLAPRSDDFFLLAVARQRIEFLSRPNTKNGETWTFAWSYRLAAGVSSSDHFFHIMQLFSRATDGFLLALDVLTLDAAEGPVVRIVDADEDRCSTARGDCPSVPLGRFEGRTTRHMLKVKFGDEGWFEYTVTTSFGAPLLSYSRYGTSLPSNGYVKTGLYRAVVAGATRATAYAGDFSFKKVA